MLPVGNIRAESHAVFNGGTLSIEAKNNNRLKNTVIGGATIRLADFINGQVVEKWVIIVSPKDHSQAGEVLVRLQITGPDSQAPNVGGAQAGTDTGARGALAMNTTMPTNVQGLPSWQPQGATRRSSGIHFMAAGSSYAVPPSPKGGGGSLVEDRPAAREAAPMQTQENMVRVQTTSSTPYSTVNSTPYSTINSSAKFCPARTTVLIARACHTRPYSHCMSNTALFSTGEQSRPALPPRGAHSGIQE
jgi:hypothetical protein